MRPTIIETGKGAVKMPFYVYPFAVKECILRVDGNCYLFAFLFGLLLHDFKRFFIRELGRNMITGSQRS